MAAQSAAFARAEEGVERQGVVRAAAELALGEHCYSRRQAWALRPLATSSQMAARGPAVTSQTRPREVASRRRRRQAMATSSRASPPGMAEMAAILARLPKRAATVPIRQAAEAAVTGAFVCTPLRAANSLLQAPSLQRRHKDYCPPKLAWAGAASSRPGCALWPRALPLPPSGSMR